jgi:hypothetical protein
MIEVTIQEIIDPVQYPTNQTEAGTVDVSNKVDKITGYSLTKNDLTDLLKSYYDSAVSWISTNGTNLVNHLSRSDNPHNTTAQQVGAPSGSGTSSGTNTGDQNLSLYALLNNPSFGGLVTAQGLKVGANTFPTTLGVNNQVLTADGNGDLYWKTPVAVSGTGEVVQDLSAYATLQSPTFSGTVGGITKAMIGLSLVPNIDFTSLINTNTLKISFDAITSARLLNTQGTNSGDENAASIKSKLGILTLSGINTGDQILPTTLPASDVYTWAKDPLKPTYTTNEIADFLNKRYVTDAEKTKIANAVSSVGNTNYVGVSSYGNVDLLTGAGNTFNWSGSDSNLYKIVLTKDSVLTNPTSPISGAVYQFLILQNGTGLWSLSYGNVFKFPDGQAPVIDANPNSKGILTALYDGTSLLVVSIQNFL